MQIEFAIEILAFKGQKYTLRKTEKFNQNQLGGFALSLWRH